MFYDRIEKLCVRDGISVTRLAQELGLSSGVPTGWKSGSVPRRSTVKKIADYFKVDVDSLLSDNQALESIDESKKPTVQMDDGFADRLAKFISLTPEQQQQALDILQLYIETQGRKQ